MGKFLTHSHMVPVAHPKQAQQIPEDTTLQVQHATSSADSAFAVHPWRLGRFCQHKHGICWGTFNREMLQNGCVFWGKKIKWLVSFWFPLQTKREVPLKKTRPNGFGVRCRSNLPASPNVRRWGTKRLAKRAGLLEEEPGSE